MSDVDRYEFHPGDYRIYEYGGLYRAKSRLAAGLPPVASNADFETIFEACQTALGSDGGVIRLAPTTTFTAGDTINITDNIAVIGDYRTTIIRPSGAPWAKPLFALDQYQGTETRQTDNLFRDFKVDMQNIAGSTVFAHYNLRLSLFENLWLTNWKDDAFFLDATDGFFNFWNVYKNIFVEASSADTVFDLEDGANTNLDSFVFNVFGTCTDMTDAFRAQSCGNWSIYDFHPNFPVTGISLDPNQDGQSGVCLNIRFYNTILDNCSGHCVELDKQSGNMEDILFDNTLFVNTPDNFNLWEVETAGTNLKNLEIRGSTITGSEAHEYIIDNDDATKAEGWQIHHNFLPVGGTGDYLNVPTHMVTHDLVNQDSSYQLEAGGAWVGPVWVGTPPNGWDLEMYNSNLGQYRHYAYLNGGWRFVALA